jgi:hypothetical protein
MTEPGEVGWRVRMGGGLLVHAPLGDALREAHRKEDERERLKAEWDAKQRQTAVAERLGELRMAGREPRSQQELLAQVSEAQDRQDRRDMKEEGLYKQRFGERGARPWVAQLAAAKAERLAREAEAEATPASKAELGRQIDKLKNGVANAIGKLFPT